MIALSLWTLNRCTDWTRGSLPDAWRDALAGLDAKLGDRSGYDRTDLREELAYTRGALMHEGRLYDEYFVPIPLKCIGAPSSSFWEPVNDAAALRERLTRITAPDTNPCFRDPASYWRHMRTTRPSEPRYTRERPDKDVDAAVPDPHHHNEPWRVRMGTAHGVGYYEILRREFARTGRKHVIVGYSQGGLVARYLAFLDEAFGNAFEGGRCIEAVIGVQAPLRGSPLADHAHHDRAMGTLLTIALALAQFFTDPAQLLAVRNNLGEKRDKRGGDDNAPIDVDDINDFLDRTIAAVAPDPERRQELAAADYQYDLLVTARKWLSGLSGIQDLAFYDLDPRSLSAPGRVLHDANVPLAHVHHGAVVGTNNDVRDFVVGASGDGVVRAAAWIFRELIGDRVWNAQQLYTEFVMRAAYEDADARALRELDADVRVAHPNADSAGRIPLASGDRIPAFAHDFVIPAASQAFAFPEGRAPDAFLGNRVNAGASHLSGANGRTPRVSDEELVLDLLHELAQRLLHQPPVRDDTGAAGAAGNGAPPA